MNTNSNSVCRKYSPQNGLKYISGISIEGAPDKGGLPDKTD